MSPGATRVLLVEDNRDEAILMQCMLTGRSSAFAVVWVDRLAAALKALAGEPFAAVILDMTLPDSRGLATVGSVIAAAPATPVVVVTGVEDEALALSAIRNGAQDYLVKDGLTGVIVTRAIHHAMDRKRIEQNLRDSETRFKLLAETSSRLLAAENPQTIVESLCRDVMAHLDCQMFFNYLVENGAPSPAHPTAPRLRLNACAGIPDAEAARIAWLDFGVAVCGCVARDGVRIVAEDISNTSDPRTKLIRSFGVRAYCCHPLQAQGRTIGTLSFGTRTRSRFSDEDIAVMKSVTDQVSVAMQRLEAQRVIEDARQEWERTFDSVPDLIAILDEEQHIRRANRAMAERLKTTPLMCIGQHCYQAVHGTSCPPGVCPHRRTLEDGKEHMAEVHEERLGGDFLVSTTPLLDRAGRRYGVVHVARDITEVKLAETREKEALAAATAARSAMDTLQAMGEGVLLADMMGRIHSVNPALGQLGGYPPDEAVGSLLRDWLPRVVAAEDLPHVRRDLERAIRGETPDPERLTLLHRDGRRLEAIAAVSFIRSPRGEPTSIVVTVQDISPLVAAQKRLADSERKYRELVEHANSIIMRITPTHTITFFNEYAQKFFGFTEAETIGKNVIGTIAPAIDSEGRDMTRMTEAITADPERYASNENENRRKDGTRVWVHWANRAIRDAQGNVVELLCVGTDITERRRMQDENRRYQERLRGLAERLADSEEKERWQISRYIHDTIIQNLSLCSMKLGTAQKILAEGVIGREADNLLTTRKLVDDAIAECRTVMSELTPPLLYELGLVPALQDLADTIRQRHGIQVRVEEKGDFRPMDNALRGLLFQSARELVMNAIKHAGPGAIQVGVEGTDDGIAIRVQDAGRGFEPARLERHGANEGGFGLFSIRERVEGMGGRLDIRSAPGAGTVATIVLPLPEPA